MKPVDQQGKQDCLRACIASIFELPLEAVPFFGGKAIELGDIDRAGLEQDSELRKWLADRGFGLFRMDNPKVVFARGLKSALSPWGYCLAGGNSPRGD